MISRFLFSIVCAALAVSFSARADEVDDYVQKALTRSRVPGMSIAVIKDGKVIKAKGYGLADVELNAPATENTVYQWASVTKQFTSAAILLLVQDGKLKLDDPVAKHYPAAPQAWKDVTIRHLLNHTSGIRSVTDLPEFRKNLRKDYGHDELIDTVKDLPLDFQPGEKWRYNNTGYLLLGAIVENVSGRSYEEFLKQRVFAPLEMKTARLNDQADLITNRATGYYIGSNEVKRAVFVSPTQPFSAGALVGTVFDLAKWDASLYQDKVLPSTVREEMWKPVQLAGGKTYPYGYGWQLGKVRDHKYVGHGGGIDGFTTFILRLIDDKLSVVVLQNGNGISPQTLCEGIAARYLPELSIASLKPGKDPDPALTARLRKCLSELSETKDSEILTDSFRKNFANSRRRHGMVQADVNDLKEFSFLSSEKPETTPEGDNPVSRSLLYKLSTSKEPRYYKFDLTADNKIASINIAEE